MLRFGITFDRGLSFMLGAMSQWVYNRNPTKSLHFEGPLKELKDDLASGKKVWYSQRCIGHRRACASAAYAAFADDDGDGHDDGHHDDGAPLAAFDEHL